VRDRPVTVSNPDKVFFPVDGITKADVVGYYAEVADRMLPFVVHRPLTIQRFPDGIEGEGWLQKNAPDYYPPSIGRLAVPKAGGTTTYPVITDRHGLLYLADQGAITFHVPPVLADDLVHPDVMIFDLDPPPNATALVRSAAYAIEATLDDLGLPSYPKTTGSKGYHVHVFTERQLRNDAFASTAKAIAETAVGQHPELLTIEIHKDKRGGRVFVDWLRNRFPSTSVAPYSLRPKPHAPVAAPLRWEEVRDVAPTGITLRTISARLEGPDPWAHHRRVPIAPVADALGIDRSAGR